MKSYKIFITAVIVILAGTIAWAQISIPHKHLVSRNQNVISEVYEPSGPSRSLQTSRIGQGTTTAESIVEQLTGTGIAISNVQFTGRNLAGGSFTGGTGGGFGFSQGIVLSSGAVSNVIGPNNTSSKSSNNNQPGDADLDLMGGDTTFDAAVLEFDFIPQYNRISLEYLLASEEYPEMIDFADVMAIYINGVNIALVPGTAIPVSIGNINNLTNSQYYISNLPQNNNYNAPYTAPYNTQADGFTVPIRAYADVTAGQTHHIKIAIADLGDSVYDTWLLLNESSFYSAADVAINFINPINPTIGSIRDYRLIAHNYGVINAQDAIVNFRLPFGSELQSLPTNVAENSGAYIWSIGEIASGDSFYIDLPALVQISPPGIGLAEISSTTLDNNYTNNRNIPYLPPQTTADIFSMNEDEILNINVYSGVLRNDNIYSITLPVVQVISQTQHGSLLLQPNGAFIYTPLPDYFGIDSFTYKVFDGQNYSSLTTVQILVNNVNDAPVLNLPVDMIAVEDIPLHIDLSQYIYDADSDPLTVSISGFTNGNWDIDGLDLTITGNPNWFGNQIITLIVNDGITTASGHLTFIVNPIKDVSTSVDTLDFGNVVEGSVETIRLYIHNTGGNTIHLISPYLNSSNDAFTFTPESSNTISAGDSVFTDVTFAPSIGMLYSGTFSIFSDVYGESPHNVILKGNAINQSAIEVLPQQIDLSYISGSLHNQVIRIFNTGDELLNWSAALSVGSPNWLSLDNYSGSIPENDSTFINLLINLNMVPANLYSGSINFTSNAANNTQLSIPYNVSVSGTPHISIVANSIDFGTQYSGIVHSRNLVIENTGSDNLHISASVNDSAFRIIPDSLIIHPFSSENLTIELLSNDQGSKSSLVTLITDDPINPQLHIPVSANLVKPPTIGLSSYSITAFTVGENTSNQTLRIQNNGSETLTWQANMQYQDGFDDWLSMNPYSGSILPGTGSNLNLHFSPDFLNSGHYHGMLVVNSNDPINPSVAVFIDYYKENYYYTFFDNNNNANTDIPDNDIGASITHNSPLNPIEFNVYCNMPEVSSARLIVRAYDVEEFVGENCPVYINGHYLGILRGSSGRLSSSIFTMTPDYINNLGKNIIQIEVDTYEAGDGISVQSAQLVINNIILDAQVRYIQKDKSAYVPGENALLSIETDTQLSSQAIMVETNLLNSQDDIIICKSRSITIQAAENDAFMETLLIPDDIASGIYFIQVSIFDQLTDLQQDMMTTTLEVLPNRARIILDPNEIDFGILPVDIPGNQTLQITNTGNMDLNIDSISGTSTGLSSNPPTAILEPGHSQSFTITLVGSMTGIFNDVLNIHSNDPVTPIATVNITSEFIPNQAYIAANPTFLNFGECFTGQNTTINMQIKNLGPLNLEVSGINFSNPSFQTANSTFNLTYNQTMEIPVVFNPAIPGNYNSTITLLSNAYNATQMQIPIYATAVLPPDISYTPQQILVSTPSGSVANTELTVNNVGGSLLRWSLSENLGNAIHFNGYSGSTQQWATIPNRSEIQLAGGSFTLSFWFKSESNFGGLPDGNSVSGGKQYLISKSTESQTGFFGIYIDGEDNASTNQNLVLNLKNSQGLKVLRVNNVLNLNHWYNVSAVYSEGIISLNLDGIQVAQLPVSGFMGNTSPWILGKLSNEAGRYYRFQGSIDELRFFNEAKTATYLNHTMFNRLSALEPNITGYWNFDSNNLHDNTSSNNHGSSYGNVQYPESNITGIPNWVHSNISFGEEQINSGQNISLSLSAIDMMAGDYPAQLQLLSNDAETPIITIPLQLNVTGSPILEFNPSSINFGNVIINTTKSVPINIQNTGTDILQITNINSNNSVFNFGSNSLTIPPQSSAQLTVSYLPVNQGLSGGLLSFQSNSPGMTQISIPLSGTGALPPSLSYNPLSITQNLNYGETAVQLLEISNSQGVDLSYELSLSDNSRSNTSGVYYNLTSSCKGMTWLDGKLYFINFTNHSLNRYNCETESIETSWIIHESPYSMTTDGNTLFIGSVSGRIYNYSKTGSLIQSFVNPLISFTPTIFYYDNSLYLRNAYQNNSTIYQLNLSGVSINQYTSTLAKSTQMIYVPDHLPAPFYALQPALQQIVRFSMGTTGLVAVDTLHVPMGNSSALAHNGRDLYLLEDAKNYMTRINDNIDEFNWVSLSAKSGNIPAGTSETINLNLSARNSFAGNYAATLNLITNDPANLSVDIPVIMQVQGQSALTFNPNQFDFGTCYQGYPNSQILHFENNGSAELQIMNIETNGYFNTSLTSLVIQPWQSFDLPVVYNPTVLGTETGTLSFSTNDSDHQQISISLSGTCNEAPDISILPTHISEDLLSDDHSITPVQIQNNGITPLNINIIVSQDSPLNIADASPGYDGTSRLLGHTLGNYPYIVQNAGAVMVNDTLYTISYNTNEIVVQTLNPQLELCRYPIHSSPYGIAFDGIDFWIGSQYGNLYRYHKNLLRSGVTNVPFALWDTDIDDFLAFAFDGQDIIIARAFSVNTPTIFKRYSKNGLVLNEYYSQIYCISQLCQISTYGQGNLWAYRNILDDGVPAGGQILKIGLSSNQAQIITAKDVWDDRWTYTIAHDGNDFLISDIDGPLIRVDDGYWLGTTITSKTIAANSSSMIPIKIDPAGMNGGNYLGNVSIFSNDPDSPMIGLPVDVHITGYPEIRINPISAVFDTTLIGNTKTKVFSITNTGNDVLVINSITSSNPAFSGSAQSLSIPPAGSQNFTVAFTPNSEGMFNSTITINSNATLNQNMSVTVSGYGLLPRAHIEITPNIHDFGSVYTNSYAEYSFVIRNNGNAALNVSGIQTTENVFSTNKTFPFSIPVNGSTNITLRFSPTSTVQYQGVFSFLSNADPNPTYDITLIGTGLQPLPHIAVNPTTVDFGQVVLTMASTRTLRILNTGQLPLQVSNISSPSPELSFGSNSFIVGVGQSENVLITLISSIAGTLNGNIQISSNDPDSPILNVPYTGTAINGNPAIYVTPSSLNFGSVIIGDSLSKTLNIKNTGNLPLNLHSLYTSNSAFSVSQNNAILNPQQTMGINVVYHPQHAILETGKLFIQNNSLNNPNMQLDLSGTGQYAVNYSISPAIVDVYTNQPTYLTQVVTIRNTGQGNLNYHISKTDLSATWLDCQPNQGVVTAGNSADITLTMNTTTLDYNLYATRILISSNSQSNPEKFLNVLLNYSNYNITTHDNEDNFGNGIADNDMDTPIGLNSPINPVEFNIFTDATTIERAQLRLICQGASSGEVSKVYFNNHYLGTLSAPSAPMQESHFNISPSLINLGVTTPNTVRISMDETGINPTGTSVLLGALGYNRIFQNATIKEMSVTPEVITPFTSLTINHTLTTTLFNQSVRIESKLYNSADEQRLNSISRVITLSAYQNSETSSTWNLNNQVLPGDYFVIVEVYDNNSNQLQSTQRIDIIVRPNIPVISFDNSIKDFGNIYLGYPKNSNLTISNVGAAPLVISSLHFSNPYFSSTITDIIIAPNGSYILPITANINEQGLRDGVLTIASNDPNAPSSIVNMRAFGKAPPQITIHPNNIAVFMQQYSNADQQVVVLNSGLSSLEISEVNIDGLSWASYNIQSHQINPSDSTVLSLSFASTGLEFGLYGGILNILSNDPANPMLSIPISVDINPIPVIAEFAADSLSGLSPLTVQFQSLAYTTDGSNITSWEWDFENDGTVDSNLPNPSHTYNIPGTYDVRLKVQTNLLAEHQLIKSNYIFVVNNSPQITATIGDYTLAEDTVLDSLDLSVYFFDPDNDILTYQVSSNPNIDFIISDQLLTINPQPNYSGSEYIEITASDPSNASVSQLVWVHVTSVNDAPGFVNLPTGLSFLRWSQYQIDFSQYISDTDTDSSLITINITGNINTTNTINGHVVTFGSLGDWFGSELITITINDNYQRDIASAVINLTVLEGLTASFNAMPTDTLAGIPVSFTNTVIGNPTNYEWDFENDGIVDSYEPNPAFVFNLGGDYSIRLKVMYIANGDTLHSDELVRQNYIHVIGTHIPGGFLLEDWVLAGSPYNISGPVIVPSNISFTINPNVLVNILAENVSIKVLGSLQAGTVNFQNLTVPQWQGIEVESGAIGISLTNTIINNAEKPLWIKAPATIHNCTIRKDSLVAFPDEWAIRVGESVSPTLESVNISNYQNGILIESNNNSQPIVSNIRVRNSSNSIRRTNYGLKVMGKAAPTISNLEIIGFGTGAYFEDDNQWQPSPTMVSNITVRNPITDNLSNRTGIWVKNLDRVTIVQDSIFNCENGIIIENELQGHEAKQMIGNVLVQNTLVNSPVSSTGLLLTGNLNPRINNVNVRDFAHGIRLIGTNTILETLPIICNSSLINTHSNINDGIGLFVKDFPRISIVNDSIFGFSEGIRLENSNNNTTNQPIVSNIRVRNSSNSIRNRGTGIYFGPGVNSKIDKSVISYYGVGISAVSNAAEITENILLDNDNALLMQNSLAGFKFIKNDVLLSSTYQLQTASAIKASEVPGATLNNNTIINYPTLLWAINSTLLFTQNIGWSSSSLVNPFISANSTLSTRYNDIFYMGGVYPGVGNINADPLFESAATLNYHLTPQSPCIDSGDPTWVYDEDGSIADIGAHPYLHMANFTSDSRFVLPQTLITFNNISVGHPTGISTYAWDFNNDGIVDSNLENPAYTYSTLGRYNVSLKVTTYNIVDSLVLNNYVLVQNSLLLPPQNIKVSIIKDDVRIYWDPVTQDVSGNLITPNYYFVYSNKNPYGQYRYIGFSEGASELVIKSLEPCMYYIVIAFVGTRNDMDRFLNRKQFIDITRAKAKKENTGIIYQKSGHPDH